MRTLLLLFALTSLLPASANAQTLSPGDIALVGMYTDNPDAFAFVAIAPLSAGTEIHFTDNGWMASGGFRSNEGTFTYTVPAGGHAPGTVIVVDEPTGPAFATAGDQILAYQGDASSPTFIHALNVEGAAQWQADAFDSNTSALPAGLVNGSTAVAVDEADNVAYNGPTTGTRTELLAAIGDAANWQGDDTDRPAFPAAFTVTGGDGNTPPQFTSVLTSQAILAGQEITFDYEASDADFDDFFFSLVSPPAGTTIDAQTGVFAWTPSLAQAGSDYDITVEVSDGIATAQTTATLTVNAEAPNEPPVFREDRLALIVEEGEMVSFTFEASDPEGDAVTLMLTESPLNATFDASTGVFTWPAGEAGIYRVGVSASDGEAASERILAIAVKGTLFPSLGNESLLGALRDAYAPDQTLGYDRARDTLYARVEAYGDGEVSGIYTDYTVALPEGFDPSSYLASRDINAEHIWPQSMGAGEEPQRSDMYILYPARAQVNSARGNLPYGDSPDEQTTAWYYLDMSQSTIPAQDIDLWSERKDDRFEPREARKGDVARASLYFYTMYEDAANEQFLQQQLSFFDEWLFQDPVSEEEALRAALIQPYQGNVNPYLLDDGLYLRIFGIVESREDTEGVPEAITLSAAYPNPLRTSASMTLSASSPRQVEVEVYDVLGRRVAVLYDGLLSPAKAQEVIFDATGLPGGVYFVRASGEGLLLSRTLIVAR